jgi:hypothetical protein
MGRPLTELTASYGRGGMVLLSVDTSGQVEAAMAEETSTARP